MLRKGLMIGAVRSGSGKTLLTLALLRELKRRGLRVRPYKVGPDYLDGTYHKIASGVESYNLDSWIMGKEYLLSHFFRTARDYDIAVVEGVMGLFDGYEGSTRGSSAELAQILGIPVILVVDCGGFSGSIAPLVYGFTHFNRGVSVAGIILNNVASINHLNYLTSSLRGQTVPVVGWVFRDESLTLDHRHLGLITASSLPLDDGKINKLNKKVMKHIDIDKVLQLSEKQFAISSQTDITHNELAAKAHRCRIGVANDDAFHFYYAANLDLLKKYGADIIFFSPLVDKKLPQNIDALYIGGGYPESNASALSANRDMIRQVKDFAQQGGIIYAECGGLIYLGESIDDGTQKHALCGILDLNFRMLESRKMLGYAEIILTEDTVIGNKGGTARGHEFHYSEIIQKENGETPGLQKVYSIRSRTGGLARREGFTYKNVLASYVHLHFGSNERFAEQFVENCTGRKTRKKLEEN
jgi:cobyrinic acid a,c-diamide synthase